MKALSGRAITVAATLNNQQYTGTEKVTNNPQGRIELQKYLINSWEQEQENQIRTAFAGAHFDVYLLKDGKIQEWVSSGVTDSKGEPKFEGLDATCDYLLVETERSTRRSAGRGAVRQDEAVRGGHAGQRHSEGWLCVEAL